MRLDQRVIYIIESITDLIGCMLEHFDNKNLLFSFLAQCILVIFPLDNTEAIVISEVHYALF